MSADALCPDRSDRFVRVQILVVLLTLLAVAPTPASAVVFPFEWLIEDGAQFTPLVPGLSAWAAPTGTNPLLRVFPIVNQQVNKNALPIGTARLFVWGRTTADPYATTFGPLAGLAVLQFPFGSQNTVVHLGFVQTPSGALKTTIGAYSQTASGPISEPSVRGSWLIGNGSTIGGGDGDDLVVGGFWVADTPQSVGAGELDITLLFASPGVGEPAGEAVCAPPAAGGGCVGSFFGITELLGQIRKVRADTGRFSTVGSRWAHLMIIHGGDDTYILVACSTFTLSGPSLLPASCTLSGTEPPADALSGRVDYTRPPGSISTILEVEAFLVSPGAP